MTSVPSVSAWNDTTVTQIPTVAPINPIYPPTYYLPSTGQMIMYAALISIVAGVITYLNRRNARLPQTSSEDAADTTNNTSLQVPADTVKGRTPEEQIEYVTKFLKTQKFTDDQEFSDRAFTGNFSTTNSSSLSVDSIDNERNDLESSNIILTSENPYPTCAICLERFKNGDDICCAQHKECPHEFHVECLFPWLLKSQDCPCCRRDYLSVEPTLDMPTAVDETTRN